MFGPSSTVKIASPPTSGACGATTLIGCSPSLKSRSFLSASFRTRDSCGLMLHGFNAFAGGNTTGKATRRLPPRQQARPPVSSRGGSGGARNPRFLVARAAAHDDAVRIIARDCGPTCVVSSHQAGRSRAALALRSALFVRCLPPRLVRRGTHDRRSILDGEDGSTPRERCTRGHHANWQQAVS